MRNVKISKYLVLFTIGLFIGISILTNIYVNVKADSRGNQIVYLGSISRCESTINDLTSYDNSGIVNSNTLDFSSKINKIVIDDEIDQKQEQYCGWGLGIKSTAKLAQSFTPTMPILTRVKLFCWQESDNYDGLKVSIRASPFGTDLRTSFKEQLPGRISWVEFNFDYLQVFPGKQYYIIWQQFGGGEVPDAYWGFGGGNPYINGSACVVYDDSIKEPEQDKCPNPIDFCFRTYGFSTTDPIAEFSYIPEEPCFGDEITYNASSSFDPNGYIVNYEWDFGDGDTSTGKITTHTYTQWDEYSVNLTVTDNDGKKDSITKTIKILDNIDPIVRNVNPEINFLYIFSIKIPFQITVIIGDIDIIVEAIDNESCIDYVKLEIDHDSKIFWSEPYEYSWTKNEFGKVTIKVFAYDNAGNENSKEIEVWKFF